jgi:predicted ATPase
VTEGATRIEFRCSPYHQNSAFYPLIDHFQRLLQFQREDSPQGKLGKLRQTLAPYRFPQAETLPLLAALLSVPQPETIPPLTLSPQRQKQKTQEALIAWIMEDAQQAAVYCAWEDLHWVDPSTLEVLTLFVEQIPTARVFSVLTCRPEFTPPWSARSYLTHLTLSRLGPAQVETMVANVTGGKALPVDVVQQIVTKTDGVPLFVEELSKMVLESGLVQEEEGRYVGTYGSAAIPPLAIPSTLQDSLMARLDRLAPVRDIAQIGAVLGREFSYDLLHSISPLEETLLQRGLKQLVEAELVYQRGLMPQAIFLFKHALIRDAAYQSLLKSSRQQHHRQIAQVLADRFPETAEAQPELVAHHYTEAGLIAQAIPYWQQAGERAVQRSAYVEAINHLTRGLELLKTLPDTPEHAQQELTLQLALGPPLQYTKGYGVLELEQTYGRALALCQQVGETPLLFSALIGLFTVYFHQREYHKARAQTEQLLRLAENVQDPTLLISGHTALALALFYLGELPAARTHFEQGLSQHDPQQPFPGSVDCLAQLAHVLWELGYPEKALEKAREALAVARQLSLPFYVGYALFFTSVLHSYRREERVTQEQAEAAITLSREHGFPFWLGWATISRGWALAEQGQGEVGLRQVHQGLDTLQAIRSKVAWTGALSRLARAYEQAGQAQAGLSVLAEALEMVHETGERCYEAELYRLKGELTLQQNREQGTGNGGQKKDTDPRPLNPDPQGEAEGYFLTALAIARQQQAKSWELRAATSLARLWQQQDKREDARQLLAEIYGWFREGFDTKDLQEAQALLDSLAFRGQGQNRFKLQP